MSIASRRSLGRSLVLGCLAMGTAVVSWGQRSAMAQPDPLFFPHINDVIVSAPPGFPIRLPAEIKPVGGNDPSELNIQVFSSATPTTVNVGLFSCDSGTAPCYAGSISIDRSSAVHARAELNRHKQTGDRLTFRPGLVGYLVDGVNKRASERFTSVMWQQENVIYTVSFPAGDRQAVIDMAGSMAINEPIRVQLPRQIPASTPPNAIAQ